MYCTIDDSRNPEMRPDELNNRRVGTPMIPQRSQPLTPSPPERDQTGEAAAGVVRGQLDRIYNGETDTPTPQTTPIVSSDQPEAANPYERTHQESHGHQVQADQWKQYHSAWQDYYQKYYERYYVGQVYRAQKALETRASDASTASPEVAPGTNEPEALNHDEALYDLRSKLRGQIQDSAKKIRKSRHFVPITAAVCVMLVFLFLQYNRVLFANVQAYISPGNIDPANIIVDPTTTVAVGSDPKLIIPKINVDVPVIYDTKPDYDSQMKAMESGVAYFGIPGANSKPGQVGNTVLSGHSSNDVLDGGSYKFIFARLDKLAKGDLIFANYEGKRYTYSITKTEVVKPTEVSKLVYSTDKPMLTLITCTPIGTALNRLLVTAEQVSPSPTDATPAPADSASSEPAAIPGNSPTFLQRIFGGGES
jgi:sortase A